MKTFFLINLLNLIIYFLFYKVIILYVHYLYTNTSFFVSLLIMNKYYMFITKIVMIFPITNFIIHIHKSLVLVDYLKHVSHVLYIMKCIHIIKQIQVYKKVCSIK
jgi:hypothetical protein